MDKRRLKISDNFKVNHLAPTQMIMSFLKQYSVFFIIVIQFEQQRQEERIDFIWYSPTTKTKVVKKV